MCWSSVTVYGAGSHLGTQSSVTVTPLSRALKRRDGNWSSLVMERIFFPGLSSLLDSAEQISKAVTRSTKAQSWRSGWCHTFNSNSILQSQHTSWMPRTQPSVIHHVSGGSRTTGRVCLSLAFLCQEKA